MHKNQAVSQTGYQQPTSTNVQESGSQPNGYQQPTGTNVKESGSQPNGASTANGHQCKSIRQSAKQSVNSQRAPMEKYQAVSQTEQQQPTHTKGRYQAVSQKTKHQTVSKQIKKKQTTGKDDSRTKQCIARPSAKMIFLQNRINSLPL